MLQSGHSRMHSVEAPTIPEFQMWQNSAAHLCMSCICSFLVCTAKATQSMVWLRARDFRICALAISGTFVLNTKMHNVAYTLAHCITCHKANTLAIVTHPSTQLANQRPVVVGIFIKKNARHCPLDPSSLRNQELSVHTSVYGMLLDACHNQARLHCLCFYFVGAFSSEVPASKPIFQLGIWQLQSEIMILHSDYKAWRVCWTSRYGCFRITFKRFRHCNGLSTSRHAMIFMRYICGTVKDVWDASCAHWPSRSFSNYNTTSARAET